MQKSLPAAVNDKVVIRSIVNCKLMARYLLFAFSINPSLEIVVNQSHNFYAN